jgi:hypothetical protein
MPETITKVDQQSVFTRIEEHEPTAVPVGYVIYQAARDMVHYLNPTAAIAYELCDGRHSARQIAEFIQKSFDLPEAPMGEVVECLATLRQEQLIR